MIEHNITVLTIYNTIESDAIRNAIETRMEVLSVVPTLQAALEYTVLKQLATRLPIQTEIREKEDIIS